MLVHLMLDHTCEPPGEHVKGILKITGLHPKDSDSVGLGSCGKICISVEHLGERKVAHGRTMP